MNCEILHSIYIRADGSIPCDDDYGQGRILGKVEYEESWRIGEVFCNEHYRHIIDSLADQRMPWRECQYCALLQAAPFTNGILSKRLRKIQIEPSLRCNILCPECSRIGWIKQGMRPLLLDLKLYENVLASLRNDGFEIAAIEYCGQGEPLTHPEFSEFIKIGRKIFPQSDQKLYTNGNFSYTETCKDQYLDKVFVACDGLFQSSYEKYRIKGSVSKVLQFMRDVKTYSPASELIWKYIVFEFNDSDMELKLAQQEAEAIGVDRILFALTLTNYYSKRFDIDNLEHFPIISRKSVIEPHPALTHIEKVGKAITAHDTRMLKKDARLLRVNYCVIDYLYTTKRPNRILLVISGWAMQTDGRALASIQIAINGDKFVTAKINCSRSDVFAAYQKLSNKNSGFNLMNELPQGSNSDQIHVLVKMISATGEEELFSVTYNLALPE